ncbi:hypothetical protein JX265_009827 [Neoarthrinium moseri]|uniref:Cytochrome P450 n=1 Tax=Neoarthrinium moseri TaxID=1658444 RepID=A0A9P9WFD0_9PEZI|nr:hypothetical protein JX265_009827 [Neoarthrinium moseri]
MSLFALAWWFTGFFALLALKIATLGSEIPNGLPWVGQDHRGPFKRSRSYLRSVFGTREMIREGYEKYSKNGRPFVLPNLFTGAEILIPPAQIDWLNEQNEENFSIIDTHKQFIRADYTMLLDQTTIHERIYKDAFRKNLTRRFYELLPPLAEEVEHALIGQAGTDPEEWKLIEGFKFWKRVVVQAVSSIFVGKPLCNDQSYLYYASRFNQNVMLKAGIIGTLPAFLRPILGYLIVCTDKYYHARCADITSPTIRERLNRHVEIASGKAKEVGTQPNDLLTWACADAVQAAQSGNAAKFSLDFLTRRLSLMNFTSTHSTGLNLNSMLVDILFASKEHGEKGLDGPTLMERVRIEIEDAYRIYCQTKDQNPNAGEVFLESLPTMEACFKETLRLRGFVSRIAMKTTTARGSQISVPTVGVVPRGIKIGVPVWGIHHDGEIYKNPFEWTADRWLDNGPMQRMPVGGGGTHEMYRSYIPFGYKATVCPGRFFAVNVIKLIASHVLLHYDIELPPNAERSGHQWWGTSISYGTEAKYLIRRRQGTSVSPKTEFASWWHKTV